MKTMARRTMSLLLAALMVLSMIPVMPHVHAAEITYGANWEYGVSADTNTSYSWLEGKFETADTDYIYGTSYDWTVTLSPGKAAAQGVNFEATIQDESRTEVAKVTKTLDVAKAPAVTTVLSYADFTEQMAGKTGNFLLTLTVHYGGGPIAQMTCVFGYTGNASDNEAGSGEAPAPEEPAPELGVAWEFAPNKGYETWMTGAFETAETDFIYEKGKAYDWSITIQQQRVNAALTVDTVIKDAEGKTVASLLNKAATAQSGTVGSPMVSASDLPDLDGELLGVFTVECTIKLNGNPAVKATVRYSRTGAASGFDNNPEEAVSVQYREGNDWIGGEFKYQDEDLVYEGNQPYDWGFVVSPSNAVTSDVTVVASIVDASGKTVSTVDKTIAAADIIRAPSSTPMVIFSEFAELTTELAGAFTLKCDLMIGETVYVRLIARFSRTPAPECQHEWGEGVETKAPDCTNPGETTYTCSLCEGTKTEPIAALNHDLKESAPAEPATCIAAGKTAVYTCDRGCGYSEGGEDTALLVHDYSGEGGKCVNGCNKTICENEGHDLEVTKPAEFAGCTTPGRSPVKTCTRGCGYTEGGEVTEPALGHWFEDGVCFDCGAVAVDVVVSEDELCSGTITVTVSVPVVENCVSGGFLFAFDTDVFEYVSGSAMVSEFTAAGISTVNGKVAGYFMDGNKTVEGDLFQIVLKTKTGAAVGTYTITGTPSLTVKNGEEIEVLVCEAISAEVVVKAHDYSGEGDKCVNGCGKTACEHGQHTAGAAATCLAAQTCTKCGTELAKKLAHSYTGAGDKCVNGCDKTACEHGQHTAGAAATCLAAQTCTKCGTELAKKLAHSYTGEGDKCVNGCGKTKCDNNGHVEVALKGKDATCTATGLTAGKQCSVCKTVTVKQEVIPAKGHTEVTLEKKDATCTATGLTAGKQCSVCKTVTVKQEVIPMKSHTEVVVKGKAATCTATGLTDGKQCSVCKTVTVKQEVIAAKGHTEVAVAGKAATCTASGLTAGKKCSVCGTVTVKQEVIAAKGHNMKETAAAVAPTCTEAGKTAVLACANGCGKTEGGAVVPATGHNHVDGACSCGDTIYVVGDVDGTEEVTQEDVVYLLLYTLYGEEEYPEENAPMDIDKNGVVDKEDVVYLLLHTMFTEMFYPLKSK